MKNWIIALTVPFLLVAIGCQQASKGLSEAQQNKIDKVIATKLDSLKIVLDDNCNKRVAAAERAKAQAANAMLGNNSKPNKGTAAPTKPQEAVQVVKEEAKTASEQATENKLNKLNGTLNDKNAEEATKNKLNKLKGKLGGEKSKDATKNKLNKLKGKN